MLNTWGGYFEVIAKGHTKENKRFMSKQKLLERVKSPNHMYSYCRVMGCPNSASAGTTEGLNHLYCRKHEDHYERHGSYTKKSYTAKDINPYRKEALAWLKALSLIHI